MDPAQTLLYALHAIVSGNSDDAREYLDTYARWRHSLGYIPTWGGPRPGQTIQGDDLAHALEDALTLALSVKE